MGTCVDFSGDLGRTWSVARLRLWRKLEGKNLLASRVYRERSVPVAKVLADKERRREERGEKTVIYAQALGSHLTSAI